MGVVHKLKDEVISFIIEQKKDHPEISVRKLSALTSEKFRFKVSKSSISAVLKAASMSSSVGRRAHKEKKDSKFTIPRIRKVQISKNIQKSGMVKEKQGPAHVAPVESKLPEPQAKPAAPEPSRAVDPQTAPIEKVIVGPDDAETDALKDENFLNYVRQLRAQRKDKRSGPYGHMGCIFLKAAEWEISGRPLISRVIQRHVAPGLDRNLFDVAAEMLFVTKYFGAKTLEQAATYRDHGWWQISARSASIPDEKSILDKLKNLYNWHATVTGPLASTIALEYKLESDQALSLVIGYKMTLEDGSAIFLDAALNSVSRKPGSSIGAHNYLPVYKAMAWLSSYLVSGLMPLVLPAQPALSEFDPVIYDLINAFERVSGKQILKAEALGGEGQPIAQFSMIPQKKRIFMIGIASKQKEFGQLTTNVKWAGKVPYYHSQTDRIYYFTETASGSFTAHHNLGKNLDGLRVLTVWQDGSGEPCLAILTNAPKMTSKEILDTYLLNYPYCETIKEEHKEDTREYNMIPSKDLGAIENIATDFSGIFRDFMEALSKFVQVRFFPEEYSEHDVSQMFRMIYELSGTVECRKNQLFIDLDVPKDTPHWSGINYAAKRVNASFVVDQYGRKVWIEV